MDWNQISNYAARHTHTKKPGLGEARASGSLCRTPTVLVREPLFSPGPLTALALGLWAAAMGVVLGGKVSVRPQGRAVLGLNPGTAKALPNPAEDRAPSSQLPSSVPQSPRFSKTSRSLGSGSSGILELERTESCGFGANTPHTPPPSAVVPTVAISHLFEQKPDPERRGQAGSSITRGTSPSFPPQPLRPLPSLKATSRHRTQKRFFFFFLPAWRGTGGKQRWRKGGSKRAERDQRRETPSCRRAGLGGKCLVQASTSSGLPGKAAKPQMHKISLDLLCLLSTTA